VKDLAGGTRDDQIGADRTHIDADIADPEDLELETHVSQELPLHPLIVPKSTGATTVDHDRVLDAFPGRLDEVAGVHLERHAGGFRRDVHPKLQDLLVLATIPDQHSRYGALGIYVFPDTHPRVFPVLLNTDQAI
jgi:hypothetical protein